MKNRRKQGYSSVAVATTDGGRDSRDDSDDDGLGRDPSVPVRTRGDDADFDDGDFNDDDMESGVEDDERLNKQLDFEVAEILRLNTTLDHNSRQSRYCLVRCLCGTRSSRTISVWLFTFLIFGVVEVVGAIKANSLAMMGDAVLMILDAATYGANIYAEYECSKENRKGDQHFKDKTHFAAALFSLVVISAVEVYVIADAVLRIMAPVDSEEPVDATIMFVLTGINALLDVVGAVMLCWEHKCCCNWKRLRSDVNLFSATLHLVSDCFRTLVRTASRPKAAVIIAATLIQFDSVNVDGDVADAGTSLAVSALICFGAIILMKEVYTLAVKLCTPASSSNDNHARNTSIEPGTELLEIAATH